MEARCHKAETPGLEPESAHEPGLLACAEAVADGASPSGSNFELVPV